MTDILSSLYIYIWYRYIYIYGIYMYGIGVAIESWPEWDLNP